MMLQRYYIDGETIMEIADENNVTKQAVSLWLKELNNKLQNENYKLLFIMGNDFVTKYRERVEYTKSEYAKYKAKLELLDDESLDIAKKADIIGMNVESENIYLLNSNGVISNKLLNILKANDIVKISDLSNYTMEQICAFRGFGNKCKQELKDILKSYGISLKKN